MKKIFSIIFIMLACISTVFAEQVYDQNNYAGSSVITDNVSVKAQLGFATSFDNMFRHGDNHANVVIGVEKYLTPWLGAEIEGRTLISIGSDYNSHTAFDVVNVNGYVKFNLANIYNFTGERHKFEPVVYTGLGWGHSTCTNSYIRNWMTYRAGVELTYNFGNTKAWGIVANPSVVWGDIHNGKLNKQNGALEFTIGAVYHFKNSNGKRSFSRAKLYDPVEVAELNARIDELRRIVDEKPKVVEVEKVIELPVILDRTFIVMFEKGNSVLTNDAKETLNNVNGKVKIVATASPEGTKSFNQKLSELRAQAVSEYLVSRGVDVVESIGIGVSGNASNRVAIITIVE